MPAALKNSWGGARAGAGRPKRGTVASERHVRRPLLSARTPVHVHLPVVAALASRGIARRAGYAAIRRALRVSLARGDFRVVTFGLSRRAITLIVEADDRVALARGVQGFEVAAARRLNRVLGRRGGVFRDRYRMRILPTRAAVRAALAIVTAPAAVLRTAPGAHAAAMPDAGDTRAAGGVRAAYPQTWLLRIELARTARPRPPP